MSQRPIVIAGVNTNDEYQVVRVTADGYLIVSGGGGGGGGDASSANQVTQIGQLTDILNAIALLGVEAPLEVDTGLTQPLTDTQLRATPVPISSSDLGTIAAKDFATQTTLSAVQTLLNNILAEMRDDVFVTSTLWEDRSGVVAVFYREERVRSQDDGTISTVYTRLSDNTVIGSLPPGVIPVQGANDREIQYYRWKAKNNGIGYTAGDWISNTVIFDVDGSGATLSSTWYNLSTSAAISAPLAADLEDPNDKVASALGNPSDSSATSDAGSFSVLSFIKRGLQNWTSLLSRIPTLVNDRIPVDAIGSLTVDTGLTQPLTDTELRASPVPISGTVTANTGLTQPLTDTELRASPVPISGTVTANTGLTQPLTDTELRASPVPISGTVTANTGLTQPLTDTELRASPVPVTSGLEDAVMLNIPPLNLGVAGTVQSISFTDIVSLEFKPRSNTEIWYTFDSDGFTTGAYEVLEGIGQSYEYGQAGRKFTGTLYLQDPVNDSTLVGFTGFF